MYLKQRTIPHGKLFLPLPLEGWGLWPGKRDTTDRKGASMSIPFKHPKCPVNINCLLGILQINKLTDKEINKARAVSCWAVIAINTPFILLMSHSSPYSFWIFRWAVQPGYGMLVVCMTVLMCLPFKLCGFGAWTTRPGSACRFCQAQLY